MTAPCQLTERDLASCISDVRVFGLHSVRPSPLRMQTHLSMSWSLMCIDFLATLSGEVVLPASLRAMAELMRADSRSELEDTQVSKGWWAHV